MISYKVSAPAAHRHFISFQAKFQTLSRNEIKLQLPAWRPGRYELGNFSKNIRDWKALDENGQPLYFSKENKDLWVVQCAGAIEVNLTYQYYAAELNAGSCFLDEHQLYINPVNCFFYDVDFQNDEFQVQFSLKENEMIACGLQRKSPNTIVAKNFDELADCPLIISATMKHFVYEVENVNYHIWIQGEVKLDDVRLVNEFRAFTKTQIELFGDIPCEEYHFLFHFTPYFIRHGVEHHNSTVIAMGPAADFQTDNLFKDLLGISCHELFHTWNVKCIRPIEMLPYDYTKENYARTGYIYEGVTTYYGDLLLWRSGAINDNEWFQAIDERLQTYFDNPGRFNLSVADSSFDTWLDGYTQGIPWRKVSIYNEGFLIAMICDLLIIELSAGRLSLDDVMREFYIEFGKNNKGYSALDYQSLLAKYMGDFTNVVFQELVNGTSDYSTFLEKALTCVGLSLNQYQSPKWSESVFGLFLEETIGKVTVQNVVPDSPADKARLWNGDEIVTVSGTVPYKNFQWLFRMAHSESIQLEVVRKGKRFDIEIRPDGVDYAHRYRLTKMEALSENQISNFNYWKYRK